MAFKRLAERVRDRQDLEALAEEHGELPVLPLPGDDEDADGLGLSPAFRRVKLRRSLPMSAILGKDDLASQAERLAEFGDETFKALRDNPPRGDAAAANRT